MKTSDQYAKTESDDNISCCMCIPAVMGMQILSVLTLIFSICSFDVVGLISGILMMWMCNDNKDTRRYLYIANVITLVKLVIVTLIATAVLVLKCFYCHGCNANKKLRRWI